MHVLYRVEKLTNGSVGQVTAHNRLAWYGELWLAAVCVEPGHALCVGEERIRQQPTKGGLTGAFGAAHRHCAAPAATACARLLHCGADACGSLCTDQGM